MAAAFLRAVSFDSGDQPCYDDLYKLCIDNGLLIKNSGPAPEIASIVQFVEPRQRLVSLGELTRFKEVAVAEITEAFGTVAHRFNTYSKPGILNGKSFEARGMISTQFVLTPDGWRMMRAKAWNDESPQREIPRGTSVNARGHSEN